MSEVVKMVIAKKPLLVLIAGIVIVGFFAVNQGLGAPTIASLVAPPVPENYTEPGFEKHGTHIAMAAPYRMNLTKSKADFLAQSRSSHFPSQGPVLGFEISRIRASSFFWKIGLWNGDIVTGINGQPLQERPNAKNVVAEEVYDDLLGNKHLTLDILRNGRPYQIAISDK